MSLLLTEAPWVDRTGTDGRPGPGPSRAAGGARFRRPHDVRVHADRSPDPAPATRPVLSPEVSAALDAGRPVVALESTLLAHGLPRPDNRAAADDVEAAVRAGGAVPATIAVLDGVPHVGLTPEEIDRVCADADLAKLGIRDLPVAAALGLSGATTVSSTALLAAGAGIGVDRKST